MDLAPKYPKTKAAHKEVKRHELHTLLNSYLLSLLSFSFCPGVTSTT